MQFWPFSHYMSLKSASRQLIKGDLRGAVKSLVGDEVIYIDPATYRTPEGNGSWFFEMLNGNPGYFKHTGLASCAEAYRRCAPVAAIINRKAQTYTNGTTFVLNTRGKVATGEAATRLTNLFARPNPLQSGKQFEAQGYIYWNLFGFNIVLCIGADLAIDKTFIKSMWNIPPSWLNIEETKRLWYLSGEPNIKRIVLSYADVQTELNIKDLFIMKDSQPSFETAIFPSSKLEPLSLIINNIIGAYESRNVLINHRGALGLLTQEAGSGQYPPMPMSDVEQEDLQKDFRQYGLTKKQWQVIITSASLKWQQMGYATKDLMLFEEIEDGIARLCDGLGYPDFLISSRQKSTFDNVHEGNKILYQDFTIPDALSIYEQWNQFFETDTMSLRLDKDYSHVPVLQEDQKAKAEARLVRNQAYSIEYERGLITLNQWLTANGEDPIEGGDMRVGDIKESTQPLAVTIGVGGVTALIAVLTAQGMSAEARQATLEVVFGLAPNDAARMAAESENGQQTTQAPDAGTTGADQGAEANQGQANQQ